MKGKRMRDDDIRVNGSGCEDPTAYEEERFKRLMATIFYICENAGFHIEERVVIRDKRTGRVWR